MRTEYYATRRQFYGFYESIYYHSDMEYDYNNLMDDELMPKDKHYELTRFNQYQKDLAKEWINILKEQLESSTGNVIINIGRFKRIDSPRYYNYETDKLVFNINFRINALKRWCFITKADKFNEYLKEYYSSRSGFCSFIPNNIDEFKQKYYKEYKTNKEREHNNIFNVMLEFYLECQVDFETDVNENGIRYWIDEELPNYMRLVKNEELPNNN